jgi:hypothetical protein
LHYVCVFLAVADHRSELTVDLLDTLAGLRLAGEPSLSSFLFYPFDQHPTAKITSRYRNGIDQYRAATSPAPCQPQSIESNSFEFKFSNFRFCADLVKSI